LKNAPIPIFAPFDRFLLLREATSIKLYVLEVGAIIASVVKKDVWGRGIKVRARIRIDEKPIYRGLQDCTAISR
jgi:hypothetical protein